MSKLEELNTIIGELEALVEQPGWQRLVDILQGQIDTHRRAVLQPARSIEEILGCEAAKERIAGINLAMTTAPVYLQALKEEREKLLAEEREKHDERPRDPNPDPERHPLDPAGGISVGPVGPNVRH